MDIRTDIRTPYIHMEDESGNGGDLYVEDGKLKWRDSKGKVTILAGDGSAALD